MSFADCFEYVDDVNGTVYFQLKNETLEFLKIAAETEQCFKNHSEVIFCVCGIIGVCFFMKSTIGILLAYCQCSNIQCLLNVTTPAPLFYGHIRGVVSHWGNDVKHKHKLRVSLHGEISWYEVLQGPQL